MFSDSGFMPHGHCYLWQPSLIWTMVTSDGLIALSYFTISSLLLLLIRRVRLPFSAIVFAFGLFIAACGGTHVLEILTLWVPVYWASAVVKMLTAAASVVTAIYTARLLPALEELAHASRLAQSRGKQLEAAYAEMEGRVAARTEELSQALSLRDQFLSVASHELKTPITSLQLQLQLAVRSLSSAPYSDKACRLVRLAERQNQRLGRLVEELLDVARIQSGGLRLTPTSMDLAALLVDLAERFGASLSEAHCVLSLDMPNRVEGAWDGDRLEQVFVNLLGNASKYAQGSKITVEVRQDQHKTLITVRDNGPGIPPDVQGRIFERFERGVSSRHISGLGLGLYIVRHIIELHGGNIGVRSVPGEGTAFMVNLPNAVAGEAGLIDTGAPRTDAP